MKMKGPIFVKKSKGYFQKFSQSKLAHSFMRCGTTESQARKFSRELKEKITPNISTDRLRDLAIQKLKDAHPSSAARYELSRAVTKLGPTGYPFEKLVARIYESEGYRVQTNLILPGRCVGHEIDVRAEKEGKVILIECKFHHEAGSVSDLKTALYVKGRADDLKNSSSHLSEHDRFALVTNTKFSGEAYQFGTCAGLELVGWSVGEPFSLSTRLEKSGLIPLTALSTLPRKVTEALMNRGIVTLLDFVDDSTAWKLVPKNPRLLEVIQREIDALLNL